MKQRFSTRWIVSKQTRKQRKYRKNAPLHIKQKFAAANLSKDLRKTHKTSTASIKKGDKVTIMRGSFKKKSGKVDRVDLKRSKIFVTGIEVVKKDGTKILLPFEPSNLQITEMKVDDKMRKKSVKNG